MKLPRDLSGNALIQALCRHWDYQLIHQVGSHVILETSSPTSHRLSVPRHRALRIGTLNAILRAVSRHKGVAREAVIDTVR
jgi:predicted RNA binding protein YcfA (HicA-like mRNA interferase family)